MGFDQRRMAPGNDTPATSPQVELTTEDANELATEGGVYLQTEVT